MKKLFALFCLVCFLSSNFVFAIEDNGQYSQQPVKSAKISENKIIKKDAGIIKLPNQEKIDKTAFEAKMAEDEKAYQKVKHSHGEGYYMFYKAADKIIRANNLDTQNWRFEIVKKPNEINAYANAANHVVMYSSMIDSFFDNEDALSAVIGHELSHHILNHIPQNIKAYDRIRKLDIGIQNSLLFTWMIFPIVVFVPIYSVRKRVWYKRLRENELEADTEALTLMARAGYDVDYANDLMSTLARLGENEKEYTDKILINK